MQLLEKQIDGDAFIHLSREDIATIFPSPERFIMASKLYKVIQRARSTQDSDSSLYINTNDLVK